MLHGRAVIDLHNTRTHRDERIVHDNALTNWMRDYYSQWTPSFDRRTAARSISECFGGVMMFENALTNDPDDYVFPLPHVNRMVARANSQTYSGADYTRGSYNSSQSSSGDGFVTNVWDFTQEQGNGTISSLGLCASSSAKCGSGSTYQAENNADGRAKNLAEGAMMTSTPSNNGNTGCYVDWTTSIAYFMTGMSSGVVTITEKSALVSVLDPLRDVYPVGSSGYNTSIPRTYADTPTKATKQYDLSSYLGSVSAAASFFDADGYLWLMAGTSNFSNGSTKTLVRLKLTDGTVTTYTVTNNTGKALYSNVSSNNYGHEIGVKDGILYMRTTSSPYGVCYINLSNNTDCGDVMFDGSALTSSSFTVYAIFHDYCGGMVVWVGNTGPTSSTYGDNPYFVYKGAAFSLAQSGILASSYGGSGAKLVQYGRTKAYALCPSSVAYAQNLYLVRTLCLTTKNNLDSAVTKTADMTMRVTYTVTDQAE